VTDGFQVTMSHLQEAAGKFRAEAETFKGAMPENGPAPADGGNWVINDALSQVLESIGLLHTQLTGVIENDSEGLDANYRQYRYAEDNITHIVTAIATGPGKAR
jgi:hypothetical protein